MVEVDMLLEMAQKYNTSAEVLLPWRYLAKLERDSEQMRVRHLKMFFFCSL